MKRRDFLKLNAIGVAMAAAPLSKLFLENKISGILSPKKRVKSVVQLFMTGGPSQIDLFDYKPDIFTYHGKTVSGFKAEGGETSSTLMRPIAKFDQHGDRGTWVSQLLPNFSKVIDEITLVKSVNCASNNHTLAQLEFNTGTTITGNPFCGAWLNFGLGKTQFSLPKSVILTDLLGPPRSSTFAWHSGNLPNGQSKVVFSGISEFRNRMHNFIHSNKQDQSRFLKYFEENERRSITSNSESERILEERLENFRLTYSMREEFDNILDFSSVSSEEESLYSLKDPVCEPFAKHLILARRLAEKEVPFIQVYCGNENDPTSWDHHQTMDDILTMSRKIDKPMTGFLQDLKQRSLLEHTLVLWGGEFGRLPVTENKSGRAHNERANTIWMAGAGVKKGMSFGETDEISMRTVRDRVEMGDIWATIAYLMGIDHNALIHAENGVEKRFTRPHHRVIHEILA